MAANLTGMFNQLNQAVLSNPMAGQQGKDLVASLSQNLGNVASGATGLLTNGQNRADPYSFMTPQAKMMQGQKDMANVKNMSSIEGLRRAATIQQKMGNTKVAVTLSAQADQKEAEMKEAENTKNAAILDAANEQIQEEAAAKEQRKQQNYARSLAYRDGDKDSMEQLSSGAMSPEDYFARRDEKEKLYKLSKNQALVTRDGREIYVNQQGEATVDGPNGTRQPYSAEIKAFLDKTDSSRKFGNTAAKMDRLMARMDNISDWSSGAYSDVKGWMAKQLGVRDEEQFLKTYFTDIINHEAIGNLPPGVASDKDIEIVMKGVPPNNTNKKEVMQYLESSSRVARANEMHDRLLAQHTIDGTLSDFQREWDAVVAKSAYEKAVSETPEAAVEFLQNNWSQTNADWFKLTYKWLPERIEQENVN